MPDIWKGSRALVTDVETLDTTYFYRLAVVFCLETNKWHYLDQNSTNTADGVNIITASPAGRWIAVNNEGYITVRDTGSAPASAPTRKNEIEYFLQTDDVFISADTHSVSDWIKLKHHTIKFGGNNPTTLNVLPDFTNQLFVDLTNGNLYISLNGAAWTTFDIRDRTKATSTVSDADPASNPIAEGDLHFRRTTKELFVAPDGVNYSKVNGTEKTNLIIDVSNNGDYSNFNDIVDPVDVALYYVPPFVDVSTYDVVRYGNATNGSGDQFVYLGRTADLATNYDLSSFVETNGVGWYVFLPIQFDNPGYVLSGSVSGLNVGLEFVSNTNPAVCKVHNFTEGALSTESVTVGGTTLTGNLQALYIAAMDFSATIRIMPYENLASGVLR